MKDILDLAIRPTLAWMGAPYQSVRAEALLLAIAHTESNCCYRRQLRGPARSYFQIEPFTGLDVLKTRPAARAFWDRLYLPEPTMTSVRAVLEFSEPAAVVIARELLWFRIKDPLPLLDPAAADEGLRQYLSAWRPGKPHAERFLAAWPQAVALAGG